MWKVVNDPGGTAGKARLKNVEVAGKTGTAQFWRNGIKDNHTWFICFAPYQKPKYAVCVFLQGAKSGGGTAAPIAARILDQMLAMDQGNLTVDVKPLTPAKGSFTFINNVDFNNPTPIDSTPGGDLEEVPVDADPADKNSDHDRVTAAAPKLRVAPDARGANKLPRPPAALNPRSCARCASFSAAAAPMIILPIPLRT